MFGFFGLLTIGANACCEPVQAAAAAGRRRVGPARGGHQRAAHGAAHGRAAGRVDDAPVEEPAGQADLRERVHGTFFAAGMVTCSHGAG